MGLCYEENNMQTYNAVHIAELIKMSIEKWHKDNKNRDDGYVIVTDDMLRIRPFHEHRANLDEVVLELVQTNTEMWHEEDKVRSEDDQTVLRAIRNINPLNQHRNDLIEEIDEILMEQCDQFFHKDV